MVFMTGSADHVTGLTGATLTITASKDGGAFASISPTVTERGNGWYNIALTTAHTDTLGDLALHVTATSADPSDLACRVSARVVDDVLPTASYTAPDNATISAIAVYTDSIESRLPAALVGGRMDSALDSTERDAIAAALLDLAGAIETGVTTRQAIRAMLAATAAKLSGAGTGTETFRNAVADSKDRIVATVDSSGNRTAITYDLT